MNLIGYFQWIYCWDDDNKKYEHSDITYKYLVNDIDGCEFNDYHENSFEYKEIIEKKIHKTTIKQTKNRKTIDDNELINLNPTNIVNQLLEHLPTNFYIDKNNLWANISRQIYLNKFENYERWFIMSAKKSEKNYTIEQNINWTDKLSDKFISTHINKYLTSINEQFNCCFLWSMSNYFSDDIFNWIHKRTKTTHEDLKRIVMNYNSKQKKTKKDIKKMNVGNNFYYDMKKQILINDLTNSIYHYGLDTGYNNQYGVDTSNFKTITQDKIVDEMLLFLKSSYLISGWKLLWGTGKTYYGVDTINKYAIANNLRVLFITENNSLNIEMTTKFNGVNHLDTEALSELPSASLVITSMESLNKILLKNNETPFEIILFDEYESIINHLLSVSTFASTKTTPYEVSVMMKDLIKSAEKIICLDCDLSQSRMKLLTNIFTENTQSDQILPNETPQLYNCNHNNWADYTYTIYRQKEKMMTEMYTNIFEKNKKIIYASTAKVDAVTIFEIIKNRLINSNSLKNIMVVTAEGVECVINGVLYNCRNGQELKKSIKIQLQAVNDDETEKNLLNQLEICKFSTKNKDKLFSKFQDVLIKFKIEILIYSPSIKCGISFGDSKTELLFDVLYGYATNGSVTAREFLQMLHRCRHLTDKRINFYVKNDLTTTTDLIENDIVEKLIDKNQQLKFNDETWWKNNVDILKYNIATFYKEITITNFKEMIDSERNYSQEILGKLRYNHNLNVMIDNVFETDEEIISTKDEYDETKLQQENIRCSMFQYENYISKEEYDKIMNDKKNDIKSDTDTFLKRDKHKTINNLYLNQSTNKYHQAERTNDVNRQQIINNLHGVKNDGVTTSHVNLSGIFQNYNTNNNDELFFYSKNSRFCNKIVRNDYDINVKIQFSEWLMNVRHNKNIGGKPHRVNLSRLNNGVISDYKYDSERMESDFKLCDCNTNRLAMTKSIMDLLEIDRIKLINKRVIFTNKTLNDHIINNEKKDNFYTKQLLYYVNKIDPKTVCEYKPSENIEIYNSEQHFYYFKSLIITFLGYVGIQTLHFNKSGGIEKNNSKNDTCFIVFQYELMDKKQTFINTYYDTIKNDIHYHQHNTKRVLTETIDDDTLTKNIDNKTHRKQPEKKYHTCRGVVYKKNRLIVDTRDENNKPLDVPFNLSTADFIYDKQTKEQKKLGNCDVIELKKKSVAERVKLYLNLQAEQLQLQAEQTQAEQLQTKKTNEEPTIDTKKMKSKKHDTRFYKYKDIVWKANEDNKWKADGNNYYIRKQIDKYTSNDKTEDNIIKENNEENTQTRTIDDKWNCLINKMITIEKLKDDYKKILQENINLYKNYAPIYKQIEIYKNILAENIVVDDNIRASIKERINDNENTLKENIILDNKIQTSIAKRIENLRDDIVINDDNNSFTNSNDNFSSIHRPNIYIKQAKLSIDELHLTLLKSNTEPKDEMRNDKSRP